MRSTPSSSATVAGSAATPTGPATRGPSRRCCPTPSRTGWCWSARVVRGSRSATRCCTRAPSTSPSSTPTERADACVVRLAKRFGDDRVAVATDLERALALARGVVNATPVGMNGHPGTSVPAELVHPDLWVSDVVYFPLETELIALARDRGCAVLPGGGMAVQQAVDAFDLHRPARRRVPDGPALRGADRLMRKGIATVSLSGLLADKLEAVAAAGFDGVEIFDNDLVACPMPRARSRSRPGAPTSASRSTCSSRSATSRASARELRRDPAAGPGQARRRRRARRRGPPWSLLPRGPGRRGRPRPRRRAAHGLGDAAAERGVVVAFEALAWGRHLHRVRHAWEAVRRADHPAVALAVDTFHLLARGDDAPRSPASRGPHRVPAGGRRPLVDTNVLDWSRHHRCFPGQGSLDVAGVVAATLEAGYTGPVSLEVFASG